MSIGVYTEYLKNWEDYYRKCFDKWEEFQNTMSIPTSREVLYNFPMYMAIEVPFKNGISIYELGEQSKNRVLERQLVNLPISLIRAPRLMNAYLAEDVLREHRASMKYRAYV